jgi:hypothetical protein
MAVVCGPDKCAYCGEHHWDAASTLTCRTAERDELRARIAELEAELDSKCEGCLLEENLAAAEAREQRLRDGMRRAARAPCRFRPNQPGAPTCLDQYPGEPYKWCGTCELRALLADEETDHE